MTMCERARLIGLGCLAAVLPAHAKVGDVRIVEAEILAMQELPLEEQCTAPACGNGAQAYRICYTVSMDADSDNGAGPSNDFPLDNGCFSTTLEWGSGKDFHVQVPAAVGPRFHCPRVEADYGNGWQDAGWSGSFDDDGGTPPRYFMNWYILEDAEEGDPLQPGNTYRFCVFYCGPVGILNDLGTTVRWSTTHSGDAVPQLPSSSPDTPEPNRPDVPDVINGDGWGRIDDPGWSGEYKTAVLAGFKICDCDLLPDGITIEGVDPPICEALGGTPRCGACRGDANGDFQVNVQDLVAVVSDWGTGGQGNNGDVAPPLGIVDVEDLLAVLQAWGACPGDPPDTTPPALTCPPDGIVDCIIGATPCQTGVPDWNDERGEPVIITFHDVASSDPGTGLVQLERTWSRQRSRGQSGQLFAVPHAARQRAADHHLPPRPRTAARRTRRSGAHR